MQLILKPNAESGLDEIIINRNLFSVGRQEQPFKQYPKTLTAKLSKRHARLFAQDGKLYLADLGSLNGTSCNGKPIHKAPKVLTNGDLLSFGGLEYVLDVVSAPDATTSTNTIDMRLVLTPESLKDQLEPIVITSFPFLVNKHNDVFDRYKTTLPEQLSFISRRHAHIFIQGDELCIEDLGSTNGTFIDGVALDEHVRPLADGNLIGFGSDQFLYRAHLLRTSNAEATRIPDAKPSKGPVDKPTAIAPSAVMPAAPANEVDPTAAPARQATQAPAEPAALAVPAEPTEPPPVAEAQTSATASQVSQVAVDDEPTRTIFVDSPTSFIDIYFVESGGTGEHLAAPDAAAAPEAATPQAPRESMLKQVKTTLFGERIISPLVARSLLALVLVASAAAGYQYWRGTGLRDVATLLAQQQYETAMLRSDHLLAARPDDTQLRQHAMDAMLGYTLPLWSAAYQAGRLEEAQAILAEVTAATPNNTQDDLLLELLQWSTEVRDFLTVANQQASEDPFSHAEKISQLLARWTTNTRQKTRELTRINQLPQDYSGLYSDIFADIRTLKNWDLDTNSVRELEASLNASLNRRDIAATKATVDTFLEQAGTQERNVPIAEDLALFTALEESIANTHWAQAYESLNPTGFRTRPFRTYATRLDGDVLPDTATMETYQQALEQWQAGQFDASAATLTRLQQLPWPELATSRLTHQREQLATLNKLRQATADPAQSKALFAFYGQLDQSLDQALITELQPAFAKHSKAALAQAKSASARAARQWQSYQSAGGIQTELRLENRTSDRFVKRASQLSACATAMTQSRQIYEQLAQPQPQAWQTLYEEIRRELNLQRSALRNLEVIPQSVRSRKLGLLPQIAEL